MKKNENEGWLLYEELADNNIQWEPTPKKFRTNDPISSKGGVHSIEANIATEAKLAAVMQRLEALETKESVSVNQVSPTPSASCTYYQAMNHVFEECPVFIAHQTLPEHMSAAFTRPTNNHIHPPIIPVGEITQISHGSQTTMIKQGPNSPTIFNNLFINKIFPTKILHLLSKIHIWK